MKLISAETKSQQKAPNKIKFLYLETRKESSLAPLGKLDHIDERGIIKR